MIIKYSFKDDYCLVHKNNFFTYYLLLKNNRYYYYEKILSIKRNKTYDVCSRLLNSEQLIVEEIKIDNYDILYKLNQTLINENEEHYCLMSETMGDNEYTTFAIYKDGKVLKKLKGQKESVTFFIVYFDYKILSLNIDKNELLINCQNLDYITKKSKDLKNLFTEKEINFYKRYIRLLFYYFKKEKFDDVFTNFYLVSKTKDNKRFFINILNHYDNILGKKIEDIVSRLNLGEKLISFYEYFKYYFSFLNFEYQMKQNKIVNKTVILYCCIFLVEHVSSFLDKKNNYIISPYIILKEKMLLFIDKNLPKHDRDRFLKMRKKISDKKIIKAFGALI